MSFIKDFLARRKENDNRLAEYQTNDRIVSTVEERKKSHAERELLKVLEEEKQKSLKETLDWERRKRKAEEKLSAHNMMKFNPEMFRNESILKQKNLFLRGGDF